MNQKTMTIGTVAVLAALGLVAPAAAAEPATRPAAAPAATAPILTNAPTAIRIGSSYQEIPVVVRTRSGTTSSLTLTDPRSGQVDFDYDSVTTIRHVFRATIYSFQVRSYGTWRWDVEAQDADYNTYATSVNAVVKANSLLGLGVRRSGSRVTVTVATRQWNNAVERYQGWPGRGVYIQKQNANGTWRNVGGVTTDGGGNGVKVLSTGAGVYRAYDKDAATVFGSTTLGIRG